jgi:type I restriction enzyme M protein
MSIPMKQEGQIDLMAVRAERLRLKAEMEGLEARMAGYLRELGYGS